MTQVHETAFLPKAVAEHFNKPPDETNPPTVEANKIGPPSSQGVFPAEPVLQTWDAVNNVAQELTDAGLGGQAAPFNALLAFSANDDKVGVPSGMNGALEVLHQQGVVATITHNVTADVGLVSSHGTPPAPPSEATLTDEIFAVGTEAPQSTTDKIAGLVRKMAGRSAMR